MKNLAAITATHRLDNFSKANLHIPDAPELLTGATVCGNPPGEPPDVMGESSVSVNKRPFSFITISNPGCLV